MTVRALYMKIVYSVVITMSFQLALILSFNAYLYTCILINYQNDKDHIIKWSFVELKASLFFFFLKKP